MITICSLITFLEVKIAKYQELVPEESVPKEAKNLIKTIETSDTVR